eukprot:TRINITY_DN115544_c0_g1_i1.p2 TRINITY_DN115544_c0_g1~~TRINITY_DN115544_c0_g1_i1.p2  ORF type:complete len:118 (+),score=16.43 TRINITY_DN115544_c0_g1_i1:300-653(+)
MQKEPTAACRLAVCCHGGHRGRDDDLLLSSRLATLCSLCSLAPSCNLQAADSLQTRSKQLLQASPTALAHTADPAADDMAVASGHLLLKCQVMHLVHSASSCTLPRRHTQTKSKDTG